MAENFDLLGDPIPDNWGKRGRPPHIPTLENRNKVMLLMAMDWADVRIANALSITVPTLRKHYFRELRARGQARDRVDGIRLSMLWSTMREGNVAAMKEFGRMVEMIDRGAAARRFEDEQEDAPEQPAGKKAQQALAAEAAGTGSDWGGDLLGDGKTRLQ